jgi:endonuclease/exonuclease/phosphatase family metal-dependent hydrolase
MIIAMTSDPASTGPGESRRGNHRRSSLLRDVAPVLGFVVVVALLIVGIHFGQPADEAAELTTVQGSASPEPSDAATSPEVSDSQSGGELVPKQQQLSRGQLQRAHKLVKNVKAVKRRKHERSTQPVTINVATFNLLGSQHTGPGGDKPASWPDGAQRVPGAIERLRAHNADVVGLQEVQLDQLNAILRGTNYRAYPGPQAGSLASVNTILYDPSVFELVDGHQFTMTVAHGPKPQTVVLLRHIATGREMYFINAHTTAGFGAHDTATRLAGMNRIVSEVNSLKSDNLPIFVTGDMNDREVFFCRVLPPTGMVAAVGGNTSGGCHPPGRMPVDWVIATPDVSFSNYWIDESTIARRISDHFLVSATATIAGDG